MKRIEGFKFSVGCFVVMAGALGGCDRTHMSAKFGEANRAAYRSQVLHPGAGDEVKPEQPLDPEEAAIVAKTYKRSLAPKDATQSSGGQLLVVPTTGPGGASLAPLPPPPTGQAP